METNILKKIGSITNADLILKGSEKEAYLQFVESGGFVKMREDILLKIEDDKYYLRLERTRLERLQKESKHIEVIREAIFQFDCLQDENHNWQIELSKLCGLENILERQDYTAENVRKILQSLYDYLKEKNKFDAHYELLHSNLKDEKILFKMELINRLRAYKSRVRNRFIRKIFKWFV